MSLWEYEEECWAQGHALVCGCDEAGAGPLAGPVYAAAVLLPRYIDIPGLDDSKQLTEKRREGLFPVIQERAEAWAVAFVEAEGEIDDSHMSENEWIQAAFYTKEEVAQLLRTEQFSSRAQIASWVFSIGGLDNL